MNQGPVSPDGQITQPECGIEDGYTTGTCDWCKAEGPVFTDNSLCETCDNETVYCSICDERQHIDDLCRHISRDEHYEWMGAGFQDAPSEHVKKALFKLFDVMPNGFVPDLRIAIQSGRFHTWLIAPLIGGGGVMELHGMPARDGRNMVFEWGDALIGVGDSDDAEAARDGYRWLVSLYDQDTPRANAATIEAIDAFLAERADS